MEKITTTAMMVKKEAAPKDDVGQHAGGEDGEEKVWEEKEYVWRKI